MLMKFVLAKFLLFIIKCRTGIQHFFTGITRNGRIIDKYLKFIISQLPVMFSRELKMFREVVRVFK